MPDYSVRVSGCLLIYLTFVENDSSPIDYGGVRSFSVRPARLQECTEGAFGDNLIPGKVKSDKLGTLTARMWDSFRMKDPVILIACDDFDAVLLCILGGYGKLQPSEMANICPSPTADSYSFESVPKPTIQHLVPLQGVGRESVWVACREIAQCVSPLDFPYQPQKLG